MNLLYIKWYCSKYFIFRNEIITSYSESVHDYSTNRSIKSMNFGSMQDSNCNKLATNFSTIDNLLIIIVLQLQINFLIIS